MPDAYDYARGRVAAKIKTWTTGVVTATRGATVYNLRARVDGVVAAYVNDTTIRATDRMIIASPQALVDGVETAFVPRMTDAFSIDGKRAVVVEIKGVPASGAAAMYHIIVRS